MIKTVLLTGATGFIGSQILRLLLKRGYKVRLVLRETRQDQLALLAGVERIITSPDIFIENSRWWKSACKDVDMVIHAAWYVEPAKYLQSTENINCLIGTLNMAMGASEAMVRRIVGIGTCSEYELSTRKLSAQAALKPTTSYAATKVSVFLTLSQLLEQVNVEFLWCRLFYLFGEGENSRRLVPYLREKLSAGAQAELTSGNQVRDFLNVCDAAEMIVDAAISNSQGAVNICSGEAITIKKFAEQIAEEYGRRDLLKFGVHPDSIFDPPYVGGIKSDF